MDSDKESKRVYKQNLIESGIDRRTILKSGGALLGGTAIAGCLGNTGAGNNDNATHIAIVSSPAGFGDGAFNDLAWKGLQNAAEEYKIELQKVEETNPSQYKSVQARLAESQNPNYDLIVLVGYNHTQALQTNAAQYSDQKWMIINTHIDQPNVASYIWANHQMSFQAGVFAGTMTPRDFSYKDSSTSPNKANIGFVGGVDSALINAFERGYREGAKYITQNVTVQVGYIGNYTDTLTANSIASSQYDAGADIIYHAAAAAGQGVFEAAQEANRFAIGVDAKQSRTLPKYKDVIMGSAVKYINKGTHQAAKAVVQDNWESIQGKNVLGLEEDAVEVVLGQDIGPKLPSVVEENLGKSRQAILNDKIKVPCSASGCQG